ncbi:hypothetical protein JTE90_021532 [Oedothorax gibbosus]|uniref:Reverse transcriptase domain-containing protein n=1 Tax=Oedothorax gibbosus TaxID=931172 RepID=A0AAV6VQC1_9ARAC|nr:hypothetical protein JTE90_021532 [Oedothorax gibbosus]
MREVLSGLDFVFCYLDDILIASADERTHRQHLRAVLQRLNKYGLCINAAKSVSGKEAKKKLFGQKNAFQLSKEALGQAANLTRPSEKAEISLTTYASDTAIGAVLHKAVNQKKSPTSFFSRTLTPTQRKLSEYSLDKSKEMCSFVPKKCDGEEKLLASDCKLSWRIYIPELDKKVWFKKECAKNIIKLLKLLLKKQDWKSLKSYHMATVILWEIKESNDDPNVWTGNLVYDRFIKALEKLEMYLSKKCLPYFLYPQYNLFHSLNEGCSEGEKFVVVSLPRTIYSRP